MKEIFGLVLAFYQDWLYPNFVAFVTLLVNSWYWICGLVMLFIVLILIEKKIKNVVVHKIIDPILAFIFIIFFVVAYNTFAPAISKYLEKSTAVTTESSTQQSNSTNSTATRESTGTQSTKQLYYSVGCSTCWNSSCNHNGYSYGGYDVIYFNYIRSLCRSCSCNSFRSQSLWR